MNGFFGRKTNTQRALSRLMMTSALVAAGTLVLSSSVMAGPWDDVTGTGFSRDTSLPDTTSIVATSANRKASGTGNLDILLGQTVNIDAKLFVARDNRPIIQTQILGNLNSNGTVVLIDRNGVVFGKDSHIDVGSLIASTGDLSDAQALADADTPLIFSNFGVNEIANGGTIAASGLVAFVAPTVKNSGVINANLGRVSLAAGRTTATVDLYGDGLVEFAASPVIAAGVEHLSENTGSITGGKIQMTAAAAKSVADSVVNMQGILVANSAVKNSKGQIVLSAGKVKLGSPSVKSPSVKGDTTINATQLDLGLTIDGDVSGSAKLVNILSTKAKISQGLKVVSTNGTVNVAAGTYNEHLVIDKAGITLNGANAGISGNGARGAETIIIPNSPGVTVAADGVTIDGLLFFGALGLDGYGIYVDNADNATLKNNIIHSTSQYGIYLNGSLGSVVSGNLIHGTGNHGIYALNSASSQILNNNIGTFGGNNNIKGDGVLIETSNGTVVKGNTITETTSTAGEIGSGVHILNSSNVTVGGAPADKNTISNTEWDAVKVTNGSNILVEGNDFDNLARVGVFAKATDGITVRNNDIDDAKMYGIQYTDVKGLSSVVGNTVDTTGIDGIYMYFSSNIKVTDNIVGYGAGAIGRDGISSVYSAGTDISGNEAAHTKRNGIYVEGKSGVKLTDNTVDTTGKNGVHLLNTTGTQITGNDIGTLGGNNNIKGDGILVQTSNGVVIKGNTITETTSTAGEIGSGVHLLNSKDAVVGGAPADKNIISNVEWDAVKITNGSNILVQGNDLDNLARVGVYAINTNGLTILNNDIDFANIYGVQVDGVTGVTNITANTIDKVGFDGISVRYGAKNVNITGNVIGYGADGNLGTPDDKNSGRDGISVVYSTGTNIQDNLITNTSRNGVYAQAANGTSVIGNIISNVKNDGIYAASSTGVRIIKNTVSNLIAAATGKAAIELGTGTGTVEIAENTVGNRFDYGLLAYSGTIDLRGATNTIQNTRVGMGFYPASALTSMSLVDDTIGTTAFIDQSAFFVDLGPDAMFAPGLPTPLDGNNATYTLAGVTIDPAANGGFVTSAEYGVLESFINHYNDVPNRGLFFFNVLPTASAARTIDQKDVLRDLFIPFSDQNGGSLTITGLPRVGGPAAAGTPPAPTGAFNPNAIEPAAGDEEGSTPSSTGDVAAVEPAAGGEASCWADATQSLGQGTPVTFNFSAGSSALLQDAVNCGNGQTPAQGQNL